MIETFSLRTAHWLSDELAPQARLRFEIFVKQCGLDHRFLEDMESTSTHLVQSTSFGATG